MAKLKIGIIGCGNIATTKHLPNLAKFSDLVQITAFCDIQEEKAAAAKARYGTTDAAVLTDYKALLKLDLDAVHVCTPNRSHCEISVAALESGKHVLCEKPMAIDSAGARRMAETAERTGRLLTVGYQNRFRVDTQTLKKMADKGELGELYMAKAHALRRRGIPTWGVFTNKYQQGGGPLIDIGTHSLDITLWVMDNYRPVSVTGSTYNKLGTTLAGEEQGTTAHWDNTAYEVEDAAFGFVKFENGATVFIETSWALNTTDERQAMATVFGTKAGAAMEFPQGQKSTDRVLRVNTVMNGRQTILELDVTEPASKASGDLIFNYPGAELEMETWLNALSGKGQLVVKPRQACVVTEILEAIYESAQTGKTVYLNKT